MNVYTTTGFEGHYPVGTAAAIVAESPEHAAEQLNAWLRDHKFTADATAESMKPLPLDAAQFRILCDGNY